MGQPVLFTVLVSLRQLAYLRNPFNPFESAVNLRSICGPGYLLEPALIMAQRKPMVAVAESSAMKRRVPGER